MSNLNFITILPLEVSVMIICMSGNYTNCRLVSKRAKEITDQAYLQLGQAYQKSSELQKFIIKVKLHFPAYFDPHDKLTVEGVKQVYKTVIARIRKNDGEFKLKETRELFLNTISLNRLTELVKWDQIMINCRPFLNIGIG